MPPLTEIFLDIETTWKQEPTLVGFFSSATGIVQLHGSAITQRRLLAELPKSGRLFTYNGHCFDLPCIRKSLGVDLRERYTSIDLRFVGARYGLTGGQKAIEQRLGIRRVLTGIDGTDAPVLWDRYLKGDTKALETLRDYNREDVEGLRRIKRHITSLGHSWTDGASTR